MTEIRFPHVPGMAEEDVPAYRTEWSRQSIGSELALLAGEARRAAARAETAAPETLALWADQLGKRLATVAAHIGVVATGGRPDARPRSEFAVLVSQRTDYSGPSGFVSIAAESADEALAAVKALANEMDEKDGDSCTYVEFALPIEAARLAVSGPDRGSSGIRDAHEAFTPRTSGFRP